MRVDRFDDVALYEINMKEGGSKRSGGTEIPQYSLGLNSGAYHELRRGPDGGRGAGIGATCRGFRGLKSSYCRHALFSCNSHAFLYIHFEIKYSTAKINRPSHPHKCIKNKKPASGLSFKVEKD